MIELTESELENIIRKVFEDGQAWGETYQGWFIPTSEQIEEQIQQVLENYGL